MVTPGGQRGSGRVLARRYHLQRVLGRGAMGAVWEAEDTFLRRTVAVKEVVIPGSLSPDERAVSVERTMREARAIARLGHPNVVTLFDVLDEDSRPWVVMELVPSRSLAEVIKEDGPLHPLRVATVGLAILGALEAAHAAGITHRDVKPGNILLGHDGRVKLTDFGIARAVGDDTITGTGLLVGSPSYIAPEIVKGQEAGAPADLWGLGATLYASVEGRAPFAGGDAMETLAKVVQEPPTPYVRAGALMPALDAMLEKDPLKRARPVDARRALLDVLRGGSDAEAPGPRAVSSPSLGRSPAADPSPSTSSPSSSSSSSLSSEPAPASSGPALADLLVPVWRQGREDTAGGAGAGAGALRRSGQPAAAPREPAGSGPVAGTAASPTRTHESATPEPQAPSAAASPTPARGTAAFPTQAGEAAEAPAASPTGADQAAGSQGPEAAAPDARTSASAAFQTRTPETTASATGAHQTADPPARSLEATAPGTRSGEAAALRAAALGAAGLGTAGLGTAGLGTAGRGTAGRGTAGFGTAGLGTAGLGTAGLGTAGLRAPDAEAGEAATAGAVTPSEGAGREAATDGTGGDGTTEAGGSGSGTGGQGFEVSAVDAGPDSPRARDSVAGSTVGGRGREALADDDDLVDPEIADPDLVDADFDDDTRTDLGLPPEPAAVPTSRPTSGSTAGRTSEPTAARTSGPTGGSTSGSTGGPTSVPTGGSTSGSTVASTSGSSAWAGRGAAPAAVGPEPADAEPATDPGDAADVGTDSEATVTLRVGPTAPPAAAPSRPGGGSAQRPAYGAYGAYGSAADSELPTQMIAPLPFGSQHGRVEQQPARAFRAQPPTAPPLGFQDERPRADRRKRTTAALLVVIGLIVVVGIGGVLLLNGLRDNGGGNRTGANPGGAASVGPATIPAGYARYDGSGFSVGVPSGWPSQGQRDGVVDVKERNSTRFIRLITVASTTTAFDQLSAAERQFAADPSYELYQRVKLQRVDYQGLDAADWEFTFTLEGVPRHVLYRGIVSGGRTYGLYLSTPEDQWAKSKGVFQVAADTFRTS